MEFKKGLVSIVIPTYGRCDYLHRSIDSVLNQTYKNIEIIVVDDNGIDTEQGQKTSEVMSKYADESRVFYKQHKFNKNGSAARNTGIALSAGEFIAFLDDDDEFTNDKIESQVKTLLRNAGYGGIYCLHDKFFKGKHLSTSEYSKIGDCQYDVFSLQSDIHTSSLLLYSDIVRELAGFDAEFRRHQDFEFLIRFFENYKIMCIKESLLIINIESEINRPNVDKLISAKRIFFDKLKVILDSYPVEKKKNIYKAHNIELFRVCLKRLDFRFLKYLLLAKPGINDFKVYMLPVIKKYLKKGF
ncbi:MAG: hypothetical protein CL579_04065 [Alteromonadaceae bacterium]|jgi:glycosyltransferase involved in cell wall biosynthesis|nr:hypothetical protein [Alteromonadaceae bacterium]